MSSSSASDAMDSDSLGNEALLLVESLLLELVDARTLTTDRAIAVVEIALETRDQLRAARGDSNPYAGGALDAILATLHRERG
jgi:hypothetical protein